MRRALVLAALLGLALAPAASAAGEAPAQVEIGRVGLAAPGVGRGALLVPVRYPIQLLGQRVELRAFLRVPGERRVHAWTVRTRAAGGPLQAPDERRTFTFVHRIGLSPRLTQLVEGSRGRSRVRIEASGALDINRDGVAELDSSDESTQTPRRAGDRRLCASVPQLRTSPGKPLAVPLPVCRSAVRWRIASNSGPGAVEVHAGKLVYRSPTRFRGTESIELKGRPRGAGASAVAVASSVQIKVERAGEPVVRAIGDSVTAGFGYYDDASPMPFSSLFECKPGRTYDDACSSNSAVTDNSAAGIEYAPDYGLSNNVSWAAQWANEHGVSNYENLAVSGSEPSDWAPGGRLYQTTRQIEAEEPDYILMTVGANPLLSEMLFGVENMGCAIASDIFGKYRECIERAFREVDLSDNLKQLYAELVENTGATVYLMQYPLSVPSTALAYSATQIAMMDDLLNREIASAAVAVSPARLRPIAPPHFDVGIDISPVYPSDYSCSSLGYEVDGRSVQSEPTQDELLVSHPLSFCEGPVEGPPWVIAGDTGIHPSAAGYAQMAAQVPAP
jgi:lysophospholipase L1-like esterase